MPTKLSLQHRAASPSNVPRVRSADQPEEVASVDKVAKDAQVVQDGSVVLAHADEGPPADIDVLYHTLVRDGALPKGFEREFATLATVITAAAERERRRMANFGNVEAAVWLHEREKRKLVGEQVQQRLERMLFDGPTARRDAEEAERQRWLQILADLLRHSPTPMGELLAAQPGNVEVLGGGKRASTLRSRVRAIRKFLQWLHLAHDIGYPQTVEHYTEYLSLRLSEPCNRGALKSTHHSLVFLNELTGTQVQDRPTSNQLYMVIFFFFGNCLLLRYLAGRASRHPGCMSRCCGRWKTSLRMQDCSTSYECTPGGY